MGFALVGFHKTTTVCDSSVPVTDANVTAWRFVYRLDKVNVFQPGDTLDVYAEHQFSNNGLDNTEIVTAIAACNSGQWYDTDLYNTAVHSIPTAGGWVAPPAGGDLDSREHHRLVTRQGSFVIPDPSFATYTSIIFKVRARRNTPSGSITIEPSGYGSMYLKHYREEPCLAK